MTGSGRGLQNDMADFQYLSYEIKDNIHMLTFNRTINPAVDEYAQVFRQLCQKYDPGEPVALLVDSSRGTLSIRYTMRKINEVLADYPEQPEFSVALVVKDTLIHRMVDLTLRTLMPGENLQLFTDRDEALVWLKEQPPFDKSDKVDTSAPDDTHSDL
jgi:hypothetical protein